MSVSSADLAKSWRKALVNIRVNNFQGLSVVRLIISLLSVGREQGRTNFDSGEQGEVSPWVR
jgi:hypothetical protein